jgi:hypothetical protein
MKTNSFVYAIFMILGILPVSGSWQISYDTEHAYLGYRLDEPDKKPPSTDGLAEILANRKKDVPLKQISFFTYFLNDPKIQEELMNEFRTSYTDSHQDLWIWMKKMNHRL